MPNFIMVSSLLDIAIGRSLALRDRPHTVTKARSCCPCCRRVRTAIETFVFILL
ncbi:MAG: hypothetical protein QNJ41_00455 [Xenococcaceae cyanobacterium MO_188.B32]|nr:hypothetical protein [Xenococcaceae cyanobacterium MO_188.B32]